MTIPITTIYHSFAFNWRSVQQWSHWNSWSRVTFHSMCIMNLLLNS